MPEGERSASAGKPKLLWFGWCPFKEAVKAAFDLIVVSEDSDADLRTDEFHVSWEKTAQRLRVEPDAIGWSDSGTGLLMDFDTIRNPTLCFLNDRQRWGWAVGSQFDALACHGMETVELASGWPAGRVAWLSVSADVAKSQVERVPRLQDRGLDYAFVGTLHQPGHRERAAFLEALENRMGHRFRSHVGRGDWKVIYRNCRVVINALSEPGVLAGDLNPRTVEALACGAVLLSPDRTDGLARIARPGQDYLTYPHGDVENAARKVEAVVTNPDAWQSMADSGHRLALSSHLSEVRGEQFVDLIRRILALGPIPRRRGERAYLLGQALCTWVFTHNWVYDWVPIEDQFTYPLLTAERKLGEAASVGFEPNLCAFWIGLIALFAKDHQGAMAAMKVAGKDPMLAPIADQALSLLQGGDGPEPKESRDRLPGAGANGGFSLRVFFSDMLRGVAHFKIEGTCDRLRTSASTASMTALR